VNRLLRILHLEDDPDYSGLVKAMLEEAGLRVEMVLVDNRADFTAALENGTFDIILGDFKLPTCTGLQALETARQKCSDTPFILVSGTIGERAAIESLQHGATDYVLKQWPERLVPAVRRAVQEAEEHAQRKRAETELVRREKYFRALTENSLDVLTILNRDGGFQYNSPSLKHVLGYAPDELAGQNAFALVHPDDLASVRQALEQALRNPGLRITHEFRVRRQDGAWCHLEVVGRNCLADPEMAGLVLNSRDVTERKRAEAQVLRAKEEWERTFDAVPDLICIVDAKHTLRRVNRAMAAKLGMTPDQAVGRTCYECVHGRQSPPDFCPHSRVLADQQSHTTEVHEERLGGDFLVTCTPLLEPDGRLIGSVHIARDITARKELEAALRQAQKMEAIGQLAGGVAHDFNNLLTVIQGHASLLLMTGGISGAGVNSAQQIAMATERAAGLTRQLLAFSRRQLLQPRLLNLNEIVSNLTKMLGRILGEDITLQLTCPAQSPLVEADAGMMEQVLMNLAVNARDAMPKGGQLAIRISVVHIGVHDLACHPEARAGGFVCLSVTDTGCGIAPEILPRIFEPFFTTKDVGKGTGLGLATVYGIAKQHQGWIVAESELGKGTTFNVFLPLSAKPAVPADNQAMPKPVRGGTETILVVEDETPVRELTCNFLEGIGYKILPARSGVEALEVWRQRQGKIDLLLTDLVMPGRMNGWELAKTLWADRPDLKVIFTSGYGMEVVGKEFALEHGKNFLQKPYDPQQLALIVRDYLDVRR
jgi:PAS domain S-box-containing protein